MVDRRTRSGGTLPAVTDEVDDAEPAFDDEADAEELDGFDQARRELEGAASDLERLTELLGERTDALDTLEALVDHLLGLVDVPLVVVDADGRIAAVSRGAADSVDALADALGKPAKSVLPTGSAGPAVPAPAPSETDGADPEGVAASRVVVLPRGSTVVRLDG